ncbi:hypothetical protein [Thalassospira lucentensis]|uniref:hypothetical protein n=1 Tax=Thalassospira lucentensis TaxID=168935 RepID=UPI0003B36212|nr:hypothetical protein [Thalassospira lucentensis]|tara:strand:- start:282 stop:446 length:165 start_codon:yes stop_codon:yes gene_type:complete
MDDALQDVLTPFDPQNGFGAPKAWLFWTQCENWRYVGKCRNYRECESGKEKGTL